MSSTQRLFTLSRRRTLMARVLLVIFMAMVGVRTFHSHTCEHPRESTTAKATAGGAHDACLLCVLQCLPFLQGTATAFQAFVAVSVISFFLTPPAGYYAPERSILTRGPPSIC